MKDELVAATGEYEDLIVVIPAGVVLAAAGIWLYIVKKRDRAHERIARAHSPREKGKP